MDYFQIFEYLGKRKIVLFGTGKFADYYYHRYGLEHDVEFYVDNNEKLWGSKKNGREIKNPEILKDLSENDYRIIIAVKDYNAIIEQLKSIGIEADMYRVVNKMMDELYPQRLSDTIHDGKYDVGYVTGAFDLFHIGHLNILKNSKSRCHHLVAGVLTDQIIIQDKFKEPFVPFEERIEIVRQCKYVDDVVAIDLHNTNKIDAWKELKYGCLFCGSDHYGFPYWMNLQKELRHLGSNLEFFPYTESTSSTMLQAAIRGRLDRESIVVK